MENNELKLRKNPNFTMSPPSENNSALLILTGLILIRELKYQEKNNVINEVVIIAGTIPFTPHI
jgi:hypothetical protein